VPLAFFSGIGAGSERGILFKDGISLEVLAKIKAVVMDKTGTLTKGSFSVVSVNRAGCSEEELIRCCAACEQASTHPIAVSILACATERGIEYTAATEIQEIAGKGIIGISDGRRIACGNKKLMAAEGISGVPSGTSGTSVYVAADGVYLGCLTLSDTLKEHAAATVKSMNRRGLHTVMLTGDNAENAQEVAGALGIAETHAGLLPTEKPEYMQKVRREHGSVLFVGDGINDAPVLSGADVGAAMGSGADVAMEAADVVFLNSDPQSILTSIEIAERVNHAARFNIGFALTIKIMIMILGFAGFANMWLSVFADTGVTILCVLFVFCRIQLYYHRKNRNGMTA
jgi:Cd2+/Zn2+-exporting ATPase